MGDLSWVKEVDFVDGYIPDTDPDRFVKILAKLNARLKDGWRLISVVTEYRRAIPVVPGPEMQVTYTYYIIGR